MPQFLRIPRRRSGALRHADRVLVVGDLSGRLRLTEVLEAYFGAGLSQIARIDGPVDAAIDALLLVGSDAASLGVKDLAHFEQLALGRQVVADLAVLGSLLPDELVQYVRVDGGSQAVMKEPAHYLPAFGSEDVLPWQARGALRRGTTFGYKAPRLGLRVNLESYAGDIYAIEKLVDGGRLAAIDLGTLEADPDSGYRDLSAMILLEALGAEQIDLGTYHGPWRSYDTYIEEVETWCALHRDVVKIKELEPRSVGGRVLRRVDIGDTADKPVVLMTNCTHGHERCPTYGVFAFLRHLVHDCEAGGAWGRTVLANLGVVWVPVVNVDGFDRTWQRGVMVPHSKNWIDLNRNYGPQDIWEAYQADKGRPKGDRPFSEPESQAIKQVIDQVAPRGETHLDFHEMTETGVLVYADSDPWYDGLFHTLGCGFDGRYLHESLSGYSRDRKLQWQNVTGLQLSGPGPMCGRYGRHAGFKHAGTGETFGNDDLTVYHMVSRIDATASFAEAVVGAVLGRTIHNHRAGPHRATAQFPELDSDDRLTLLQIDAAGQITDQTTIRARDGFDVELPSGCRLLALRDAWRGPTA